MKNLAFLALCAFSTLCSADTFGMYGDVTVVTGPDGHPAWQLTSSPSGAGYAGIYVAFSETVTPAALTHLSANYVMVSGTFQNGAPRFSIGDTTNNASNEAYVYWGTPQPGGSFTDPNSGNTNYANTGNYADLTSTDSRVQNNGFGGGSTGASYETWDQFVASEGTTAIGYITIDLDGGYTPETAQVMDVTDFDINGVIYTPSVPSTVPEPASIGLMACACALLGGFAFFGRYRFRFL